MASPVAHTLLGFTLFYLWPCGSRGFQIRPGVLYVLVAAASLAPDLDFIPGLLLRDPNRFHQTFSHSLTMAFVLALGFGAVLRLRTTGSSWLKWSSLLLVLIGSHLLLDFFTEDYRPPFGFPLFWPFSETPRTSPLPIFPPSVRDFSRPDFWSQNAYVRLVESCLLLPLWLASWKYGKESSANKP
ncbi:MAG TPA: metal-dependent hydrolase [Thermodesulfobacteriota bacterium]|nr:metal-dependent hydrolase [Thermodesulfobacteriota bacterium]